MTRQNVNGSIEEVLCLMGACLAILALVLLESSGGDAGPQSLDLILVIVAGLLCVFGFSRIRSGIGKAFVLFLLGLDLAAYFLL